MTSIARRPTTKPIVTTTLKPATPLKKPATVNPSGFEAPRTGPSGTVQHGSNTYTVKNGDVHFQGRKIGTINDNGDFNVRFSRQPGDHASGNIRDLLGAKYEGTLSTGAPVSSHHSGTIAYGNNTFAIDNGRVKHEGRDIGTLQNDGRFDVTLNGQRYEGNVGQLHGAAVTGRLNDGKRIDTAPSGTVTINEFVERPGTAGGLRRTTFDVKDGKVFLQNKLVGSINSNGDFNVTIDGKQSTGNVTQMSNASWNVTSA